MSRLEARGLEKSYKKRQVVAGLSLEIVDGEVVGLLGPNGAVTEIWQSSPVLQELRDPARLKGRCGVCEFNQLCGGCRCRAYSVFGDYLQEDPACTYQPTGQRLEIRDFLWTEEAQARLSVFPLPLFAAKLKKAWKRLPGGKRCISSSFLLGSPYRRSSGT